MKKHIKIAAAGIFVLSLIAQPFALSSVALASGGAGTDPCTLLPEGEPYASGGAISPTSTITSDTLTVAFSSSGSSGCGSDIVSYLWDFGDGVTSTEANPTHVYSVGFFTPQLVVVNANGVSSKQVQNQLLITVKTSNTAPIAVNRHITTGLVSEFTVDMRPYVTDPDDVLAVRWAEGGIHSDAKKEIMYYRDGTMDVKLEDAVTENQTVTFDYTVYDAWNASSVGSVTIDFTTPGAPTTVDEVSANELRFKSIVTPEDTSFYMLAHDIVPVNWFESYNGYELSIVEQPKHGMASFSQLGGMNYRPSSNYNGTDSFTYRIIGPISGVREQTVIVNVTPVDDPSIIFGSVGAITIDEDSVGTSFDALTGVKSVDGNVLRVENVSGGMLNPDNTISYTPPANWTGDATITWDVVDGSFVNHRTATIRVKNVNDAPTISSFDVSLGSRKSATFSVQAVDIDRYDVLSYSWNYGDGTTSMLSSGTSSHAYQRRGTYTVTVTVTDKSGATATATTTVTVK